jgi:hypothetical protein
MQIQVNIEELRKNKLFVATPMYGGMSHGLYVKSCLDLQTVMMRYGIEVKFSFLFNESLITRARNYLVDEFLRTDFTHMLFIDSDIHFDPNDIVALMALDKDVVGGPYPKKSMNWGNIAYAARTHPELDPKELDKYVTTIAEIERLTGINISPQLPANLQGHEHVRANLKDW